MAVTVSQAAQVLGVDPSRVRQLLATGALAGTRFGHLWQVDDLALAQAASTRRLPGRPFGPLRAWAALNLLAGLPAPWLTASARSQVRRRLERLATQDADHWRAALAGRQQTVTVRALRPALERIASDSVVSAGAAEAMHAGADLRVGDLRIGDPYAKDRPAPRGVLDQVAEVYVPPQDWDDLRRRHLLHVTDEAPNLLVRLPHRVWPFPPHAGPGAVPAPLPHLAADLLDSPDPRLLRAGHDCLVEAARRVGA